MKQPDFPDRIHKPFDFAAHQSDSTSIESLGAYSLAHARTMVIVGAVAGGDGNDAVSTRTITMTKLTDTQSILLSTASQREGGSLLPLPPTLTSTAAAAKAIAALLKRGHAEERETEDAMCVHRSDGDLRYGVFITPVGMAAIGAGEAPSEPVAAPQAPEPVRTSKSAAVIALLQRTEGATLPELVAATGWLPHTTRAALTGLRKKGHVLHKSKRNDATCYRIAEVA